MDTNRLPISIAPFTAEICVIPQKFSVEAYILSVPVYIHVDMLNRIAKSLNIINAIALI